MLTCYDFAMAAGLKRLRDARRTPHQVSDSAFRVVRQSQAGRESVYFISSSRSR